MVEFIIVHHSTCHKSFQENIWIVTVRRTCWTLKQAFRTWSQLIPLTVSTINTLFLAYPFPSMYSCQRFFNPKLHDTSQLYSKLISLTLRTWGPHVTGTWRIPKLLQKPLERQGKDRGFPGNRTKLRVGESTCHVDWLISVEKNMSIW